MPNLRLLTCALLLVTPLAAQAADAISSVDAATEAEEVLTQHCSDVASAEQTSAADAIGAVSTTWGRVGKAYQTNQDEWLLYWRGALAQCLGQDERAKEDLLVFHTAHVGDGAFMSLVDDAHRRLRRLGVRVNAPAPPGRAPGVPVGIGLAAGAGVAGGLAGWQASVLAERAATYQSGVLRRGEYEAVQAEADTASQAGTALAVVGIAAAAGSVASFVVTAASGRKAPQSAAFVAPVPGGVTLGFGGRW